MKKRRYIIFFTVTVLLILGLIWLSLYLGSTRLGAEEILRSEKTAIMRLMGFAEVTKVRYRGDERFLINCNTPEDLAQVETVWKEIQNSTDGQMFG